jgi:hypothetical protein
MTSWNHVTFQREKRRTLSKYVSKREERYPGMYLRGKNIYFKTMLRQPGICKSQRRKAEVYSEAYNVDRIITSRKNSSVSNTWITFFSFLFEMSRGSMTS